MKNLFWIVVASITVLSGCNGCKKDNYPTYPISDQRLLDAVNFQKGSYFIYQDSISSAIDSFGVGDYFHSNVLNQDQRRYYEGAGYTAYSNIPHHFISPAAGLSLQDMITCNYYTDGIEKAYGSIVLKLPFIEGYHGNNGSSPYICSKFYPNYQLLGNTYTNVYEMTSASNFHTFYSIESGLIKFSITVNGVYYVWELIRENIVR